jgi:O-antigen ligase
VFSFGAIGSLLGPATGSSLFHLLEWVMFIGVLPVLLAWCFADRRTVRMLAWSYLAGQVLSTLDAFVSHPVGGRYEGLSHHPNAFALAGMMSFALVLFLFHEYTDDRTRWILIGIAGLAVVAVVMSGSRASAVVVAGLVLLIPFVERSALASLGLAAVGAVGLALLPVVAHVGGSGSALSRLTGDDTTTVSDQMRSDAFSTGVARFLDAPIFGSGLSDVELTHNVYLEVAIGTGIFGFAAYLVLLGVLAMPLFGSHPLRRLSYLTWAIVGSAAALPGLWDPTMWVCAGLVSMVLLPAETFAEPRNGDAVEPTSTVLVHS